MVGKPLRAERPRLRPATVNEQAARSCVAAKTVATKTVAANTVVVRSRPALRLRHQSLKASSLIAASSDPVIVTDQRGLIDVCNPPACRLIGLDEKAVIGRALADVLGVG